MIEKYNSAKIRLIKKKNTAVEMQEIGKILKPGMKRERQSKYRNKKKNQNLEWNDKNSTNIKCTKFEERDKKNWYPLKWEQ